MLRVSKIILISLCAWLAAASLVSGQAPDNPFPPDAANIFPDYVTITSERYMGFPDAASDVTAPTLDDEQRVIIVVVDGETRHIPYPDEIAVTREGRYWKDRLFIFTATVGDPEARYLAWATYALDTVSGELALYAPCTGTVLRGQDSGCCGGSGFSVNQDWLYVIDPQANTAHLCNPATDAVSTPLPISEIGGPFGWSSIIPAPQADWLLLIAGSNLGGHYSFYGYQQTTGEIVALGMVGGQSFMGDFAGWLNDTDFLFQITGSIDGRSGVYRGTITLPDSFMMVMPGDVALPGYAAADILRSDVECRINRYNFARNEQQLFVLGNACAGVFRLTDGDTYLAAVSTAAGARQLMVLDAANGTITPIYDAEIELLYGVSPDGRYAVLLTDDDGFVEYSGQQNFDWLLLDGLQVTFFDTLTRTVVYQAAYAGWPAPFFWRANSEIVSATQSHQFNQGVTWLSNDRALLQRTTDYSILAFDGNQVTELGTVQNVFNAYPGGDYLLLHTGDEYDARTYHIFDAVTGETRPLFAADFPTGEVIVNVFGHEPLIVQIAPASQRDTGWTTYVTYEIEVALE